MKIYTKTGDDGTTGLFGGGRVSKADMRLDCYGTVDEANAFVGLCRSQANSVHFEPLLENIQRLLFVLGADLATPIDTKSNYPVPRIEEKDVAYLEAAIDQQEKELPPLEKFILPGGTMLAAYFHVARTVTRRAERLLVTLLDFEQIGKHDVPFLNRLSDLFFVLARRANAIAGIADLEWSGKKE
jgi:cob(I)alamin adenosyltransferase